MDYRLIISVRDLDDLTPSEKFILLVYSTYADKDGRNIFPSNATMASNTRFTDRQIKKVKKNLEKKGYLQKDGKGLHGVYKYRLIIRGEPDSREHDSQVNISDARGEQNNERGEQNDIEGVNPSSPKESIKESNKTEKEDYIEKIINITTPYIGPAPSLKLQTFLMDPNVIFCRTNGTLRISGIGKDNLEEYQQRFAKSINRAFAIEEFQIEVSE